MEERRGSHFFLEVLSKSVIGAVEGEVLREIACVLDLINQLQEELTKGGAVVDGKPNPMAIELRQQRMLLAKLLSLVPPEEPGTGGAVAPPLVSSPRSRQARRAAEARWAKHRRIRGGFD